MRLMPIMMCAEWVVRLERLHTKWTCELQSDGMRFVYDAQCIIWNIKIY